MRIVFVLPGRENSGGVRCTSIMAEMLRRRGHEVRILCRVPDFSLRTWARRTRNKIAHPGVRDWLDEFKGPIESFRELSRCVFLEDEIIVAVGMIISAQMGSLDSVPNPKVQYLHGSTPDQPARRKKAFNLPLPKIAVASYLSELVEKEGRGQVLAVIHNGVNCAEYFPSVPAAGRAGVGTIYGGHPAKDPKAVIEVIRRLSKERPKLPLRVFSSDRKPKEINRRIYLRNPTLQQAREAYSRSDVWVMASFSEGFSMPVLEAMACGCAVVATDCGGPSDQIIDGKNGFLVPVGDVNRIVARVLQLMDDSALRDRIQRNALETARKFTWEKCVNELETTLRRLEHQLERPEQPVELH